MGTIPASDNVFPIIRMSEAAAPSTPPSGQGWLYVKSDGLLYWKDDAGAEHLAGDTGDGTTALSDITNHLADGTDAHDAAAISVADAGNVFTGTNVEDVLAELEAAAGGGGGAAIQYGALKPGTPDDDFDAATLTGWSANNQAGTFAVGNCYPQGVDGSYLVLGYDDQSGSLYKSQANTNLDYRVGGFTMEGNLHPTSQQKLPGIAALDSSGNGVALVFNSDLHAYLAEITAYAWTGTTYGQIQNITPEYAWGSREYALRLTRVTNTWDGYISLSGAAWSFHMSATGSKTITVDRVAIGTWKPNDGAARGRILCDWMDVT